MTIKSNIRGPLDRTNAATSGSAYEFNDSIYGYKKEPAPDSNAMYKCTHTDCVEQPPSFSGRDEWK